MHADMLDAVLESSTGKDETELLCHWLGKHDPSAFKSFPIIKGDYAGGASMMFSKILAQNGEADMMPLPDWRDHDSLSFAGHGIER